MSKEKELKEELKDEKSEKIAVKDISEKKINVNELDPETLEVEKLIDPEVGDDEPMEVPNYEEEIVKKLVNKRKFFTKTSKE